MLLNWPIYLRGDVFTELSPRDFDLIGVGRDMGFYFKSCPTDCNVQPGMKTTG